MNVPTFVEQHLTARSFQEGVNNPSHGLEKYGVNSQYQEKSVV